MKYLLSIALLFFFCTGFSQQINYNDWKTEAKTNIRLLPKYGNIQKNKEQIAADNKLIADYLAQAGTHRKASELLVKLGFDYLYKGDLKTAMYRFNQAWLLDPRNENVFWAFGAIYFSFKDYKNALTQYDEGLVINSRSSNIITDKASVYLGKYEMKNTLNDLNTAIDLFKKSLMIDSKNQNTLFKLSASYYFKKDCENAFKYYNQCLRLGGKPITTEYTKALNQLCKK